MSDLTFVLACLVLVYTGFCRLVHTNVHTLLCIRGTFWLLTVAAAIAAAAVLVWGYRPGWPSALLASCVAAVQVAASILWRDGVPQAYQSEAPDARSVQPPVNH